MTYDAVWSDAVAIRNYSRYYKFNQKLVSWLFSLLCDSFVIVFTVIFPLGKRVCSFVL